MLFASLVSQLQPELREALISSGLDDPGLLRAYPRSPVEDLRAVGLGMTMATSSSSSPSFHSSVSSSIYSRVAGPVSRPITVLDTQRQGPVVAVPEMRTTAARASDLPLRTSLTLRPKGPERRRIMKKGSIPFRLELQMVHTSPWMDGHVFPQPPLFHRFSLLLCLVHRLMSRLDFQNHQGWEVLRSRIHVVRLFLRIRPRLTYLH